MSYGTRKFTNDGLRSEILRLMGERPQGVTNGALRSLLGYGSESPVRAVTLALENEGLIESGRNGLSKIYKIATPRVGVGLRGVPKAEPLPPEPEPTPVLAPGVVGMDWDSAELAVVTDALTLLPLFTAVLGHTPTMGEIRLILLRAGRNALSR
mgnify:CR=1 FL=1